MQINADTKIATVLKAHPAALEAIVALSPHFEKLRNPLLRRLMAGRTTIAAAARIGACRVEDFYRVLRPLGMQAAAGDVPKERQRSLLPEALTTLHPGQIVTLDVRPVLAGGEDPLRLILAKVRELGPGQVLKVVNTFEPTPLMALLEKQGFQAYADELDEQLVETYFYPSTKAAGQPAAEVEPQSSPDWAEAINRFHGRLREIDVRQLPMPQPMITILEALEQLPAGEALFVHHKRVPVFLLPELNERGFAYAIRELSEGEVQLLIYHA